MSKKKKYREKNLIKNASEACMTTGGYTVKEEQAWQFLSQLLADSQPQNMDLYLVRQYARLRLCDIDLLRAEYKHVFKKICPQSRYREDIISQLMDHYTKGEQNENPLAKASQGSNTKFQDGTVITKRYKGEDHIIECVDGMFSYRNMMFKHITAVAQHISQTNCSGVRFFKSKTIITHGGSDE